MKQTRRPHPTPRLTIEAIADHRDPAFREALRLYHRVFPKEEQIDRGYFVGLFAEKRLGVLFPFNAHFLVARRRAQVVGLATGTYLAVSNVGFVGYLAVLPRLKGARVGSALRARLVEEMRRDAKASGRDELRGVLGEVEAPNPWLRHLVRANRAMALDLDYYQPALREGQVPVPLVLYFEPVEKRARRFSVGDVRALLYAIYRRLYRIRFPLREPAFRKMLRSLEGRTQVGPRRGRPPSA